MKKHTEEIEQLSKTFYEKGAEVGSRKVFLDYVWKTCIKPQLGYSFSRCHVIPYTFIALQELTLYKKYGAIFWNTACLIVNSGATEADEEEKQKNTDYSKMATAIGEMMSRGINVSLVDINKSMSGFYPDEKNNTILFGIKGINSINKDELIQEIINNRPYESIEDFLSKVKVNKTMMINLIKSGAFDNLYNKPRADIMKEYITNICGMKKVLNLRNFNALIDEELVPQVLDDTAKIYKFTKFIKKNCKVDNFLSLQDEELYSFYCNNFDQDLLVNNNGIYMINQKTYEKLYKKAMDKARNWLKENQKEILNKYNNLLFEKEWNKNCLGNISKWEMDSVSFYYHEHELKNVDLKFYGIENFSKIKPNDVEMIFKNKYPIYKLTKIIGTVIGKDKAKGSIKLLTTEGVVPIKFRKEYFAQFDKQISQKQPDGTKKIIEKSWFNKGSKIMVMGYRRDNEFVPKKYSRTVGHMLYKIISVDEKGKMQLIDTRSNEGFEEESDE